jgi:hypothetical protein
LTTAATHLFRGVVDPSALSDLHIDDEKSVVELDASGFIWNEHGHAVARRSLTRHLAEEGTTFAEILEQLRRRLDSHYLGMTECRSSRSPGCSVTRRSGRSITPTKGGPEQRQGEPESLHRHCDKRPFSRLARADINFLA